MRFQTGLRENLHAPLMSRSSALVALNNNKVEPLLNPTPTPAGGRAPDSPARQGLIGLAAGAVERLGWTGLKRPAAQQAVADRLHKAGIKPGRGSSRVTARTVREWCERVAADIGGHSVAAMQMNAMTPPEWQTKIKALSPQDGRKFILAALALNVLDLNPDGAKPQKPANPPS